MRRFSLSPWWACQSIIISILILLTVQEGAYGFSSTTRLTRTSLPRSVYSSQHDLCRQPQQRRRLQADSDARTSPLYLSATNTELRRPHNDDDGSNHNHNNNGLFFRVLSVFNLLSPLWTTLVASYVMWVRPSGPVVVAAGSLSVMRPALRTLMFAMGATIGPRDVVRVVSRPSVLLLNAVLCYAVVPCLAWLLAFALPPSRRPGLVLLGCVGGGQASNLFARIAGGDVALSVVCTLSTTLLGVVATPLSVRCFLGVRRHVDQGGGGGIVAVVRSVAALVLLPLLSGLALGRALPPRWADRLRAPDNPLPSTAGVLATLVLVAGGAARLSCDRDARAVAVLALPSLGLALASGAVAWCATRHLDDARARRTLVVETVSKSPTLAYVLARQHFGPEAAAVPAAAMVTLAVSGALLASAWSLVPVDTEQA